MLQEKIAMVQENELLQKENGKLKNENQNLLKMKDRADSQAVALMKSLEALQKDIKDKEILVIFFLIVKLNIKFDSILFILNIFLMFSLRFNT